MANKQTMMQRFRTQVFGDTTEDAASFRTVLTAELGDIEVSRPQRGQPLLDAAGQDPFQRARASGLMGLALSGGGIRSATFCLGVIQALASEGLLRRFDYLSTVSGGGYIGGWLTAWIKRSKGGVLEVESSLKQAASGGQAPPLEFIRDYSNYLAPRPGLFSADTWTIASVWLCNTVLNQVVIALFFAACLLVPRLLGLALPWVTRPQYAPALLGVAALLVLGAVLRIAQNLRWFEKPNDDPKARKDTQPGVIAIGLVLLAASWLGSAALWRSEQYLAAPTVVGVAFLVGAFCLELASGFQHCFRRAVRSNRGRLWFLALSMIAVGDGLAAAGLTYAAGLLFEWLAQQGPAAGWHLAVWGGPSMLLLMATVAVVHIGLAGRWQPDNRREWWSRLGAWLFILMTGCVGLASVSIYGPLWTAQIFEAFPTWSKGLTLGWLLTTLGGVLAGQSRKSGGESAAGKSASNLVVDWAARIAPYVALPGALLALSTLLNLVLAAGLCYGRPSEPYPPAAATFAATTLDLRGELPAGDGRIRLSIPVTGVVTEGPALPPPVRPGIAAVCMYRDGFFPGWRFLRDQHWVLLGPIYWAMFPDCLEPRYWNLTWVCLLISGLAALFLAWRIDVNEFSLHNFYKNRLVRCYLGASAPDRQRKVNPFTGFSQDDDVLLAALRPSPQPAGDSESQPGAEPAIDSESQPAPAPAQDPGRAYVGPCLIVNGTLNFTHGERLAWQERKAASFVFTPRYCGFDGPALGTSAHGELEADAYRTTDAYAHPQEDRSGAIQLGTAMAISGAAVSPNMGYHTSTPVAFLLTLFDVRLGWWLGNPRHTLWWQRSGPAIGLLYLLSELFGSASNSSGYVYISDGGHFENLGIYELVRRRCRLIVACDAEEDHNFTFGGLGNAVRKCRDDLGVDITLDLRPLLDRDEHGRTSAHWLRGSIDYHDDQEQGVLLYLKSSLVKPALHEEPADVLEYAMRAREFPHQTTAYQFFDESQFESYRQLGFHIGKLAIDTTQASHTADWG